MEQIPPRTPAPQRLRDTLKRVIRGWVKGSGSASRPFHRHSKWKHMAKIPPPPVPPRMREMLKDYPAMIEEVQSGLNHIVGVMLDGHGGTPPFERAVWRLQDCLDRLADEANAEIARANASGDLEAGKRAEKRIDLIWRVRGNRPWHDRSDQSLWTYFKIYKAAFE
jgi:hypothetical protein